MTQRTGSMRWCASVCGHALSVAAALAFSAIIAQAETLNDALVKAYQSNPQLNADRARQRAMDENVSQAMAGYRPQIAATLGVGLQAVRNLLPDNTVQGATLKPWTIGVTVTQTLFNGFKTSSSVRVAEFQVKSGREALRNVGQGVSRPIRMSWQVRPSSMPSASMSPRGARHSMSRGSASHPAM